MDSLWNASGRFMKCQMKTRPSHSQNDPCTLWPHQCAGKHWILLLQMNPLWLHPPDLRDPAAAACKLAPCAWFGVQPYQFMSVHCRSGNIPWDALQQSPEHIGEQRIAREQHDVQPAISRSPPLSAACGILESTRVMQCIDIATNRPAIDLLSCVQRGSGYAARADPAWGAEADAAAAAAGQSEPGAHCPT